MQNNRKSLVFALISVLLWSTVATAFKLTLIGMNSYQLLFYSAFVSSISLVLISIKLKIPVISNLIRKENIFMNILTGLLNPFVYYIILFKAYSILQAQEAQPLNYTWPIVLSILSVIFLKNKFSFRIFTGILLSFAGVVIIASKGDFETFNFNNPTGVLLALSSSVIWASFWIINLKRSKSDIEKLTGAAVYGTFFAFLYVLFFDSFSIKSGMYLIGAFYIGLFEMGITFYFWMKALELSVDKSKTATIAFLAPFISLIFISLVLGEVIHLSSITGLVFIVGGILVQRIGKAREIQSS